MMPLSKWKHCLTCKLKAVRPPHSGGLDPRTIEWQNDPVVIYHHYQVLLQCSVESVYPSADSFQLVSEQTEIEHGH